MPIYTLSRLFPIETLISSIFLLDDLVVWYRSTLTATSSIIMSSAALSSSINNFISCFNRSSTSMMWSISHQSMSCASFKRKNIRLWLLFINYYFKAWRIHLNYALLIVNRPCIIAHCTLLLVSISFKCFLTNNFPMYPRCLSFQLLNI